MTRLEFELDSLFFIFLLITVTLVIYPLTFHILTWDSKKWSYMLENDCITLIFTGKTGGRQAVIPYISPTRNNCLLWDLGLWLTASLEAESTYDISKTKYYTISFSSDISPFTQSDCTFIQVQNLYWKHVFVYTRVIQRQCIICQPIRNNY